MTTAKTNIADSSKPTVNHALKDILTEEDIPKLYLVQQDIKEFCNSQHQLHFWNTAVVVPLSWKTAEVVRHVCYPGGGAARLQNSPYICVFKYARTVKKVLTEAENREKDWGKLDGLYFSRLASSLTSRS